METIQQYLGDMAAYLVIFDRDTENICRGMGLALQEM